MRFLDLFAGIGGFRLAFEQAGHQCIGYVEIDKFARMSYEAIHDTRGEWTAHDITTVPDESIRGLRGHIDIITGGFPCQAFSVAGARRGFEDTRGTLFFEIARFADIIRPQYLVLENVKGLLNHDKGNTFETILGTLDEMGYDVEWQVFNSKDFGVPQNRERVYIIGHLRGHRRRQILPIGDTNAKASIPIKIIAHDKKYRMGTQVFDPSGITETLGTCQGGGRQPHVAIIDDQGRQGKSYHQPKDLAPTLRATGYKNPPKVVKAVLTPDRANKRQNGRQIKEDGEPMFTVTAADRHGVLVIDGEDHYVRKLTPRECWRLQGFPDWAFDRAREVNSDTQLYKQAGNSVTVPVVYEIARRLED